MTLAAALYASVGHGGASAYLAVMGLAGVAPAEMKPIALTLNIAVSLVAMTAFYRAGHFRPKLFWVLAVASVPAAFVGGWLQAPAPVFKMILCAALLVGAWRLAFGGKNEDFQSREARPSVLLLLGFVIGFLSGLIGIGGGIFLTPLLIFFRWCPAKPAAATSAAFIFANSLSGLSGFLIKGGSVPSLTWMLLPAVIAGGWLGSCWGSKRAHTLTLQRVLAVVLIVAASKFVII
ncbi:MAG: sulfite exporter TauE/SafE family protein [Gloeobacteraceae cyanobacterium ES-bin-144]|nr:sulfite exporter TauE/SafE family protein [Verrucomicrobiales bacterium]